LRGLLKKIQQVLHPNNYEEILKNDISPDSLAEIARYSRTNKDKLRTELIGFARIFKKISGSMKERIKVFALNNSISTRLDYDYETIDSEEEFEEEDVSDKCQKYCFIRIFEVLFSQNLHTTAYPNLFAAINFILTLSFSQVCRNFQNFQK
jgi:hypothetical protein